MIPSSPFHSSSSDPALAEDTQPFVSSLTSEQRAYVIHIARLARARSMSLEQLLARSENVNNEIRQSEIRNLATSIKMISETFDPLSVY